MKNQRLAMVAAAAVVTMALSACGGGGGSAPAPAADGPVEGTIQYSWWGGPARNDRTQAVIDLYKKAHPEVTVEGTTSDYGGYWQKISVQAAGKNLPCIPQVQNTTMAEYADRGSLLPLDDLVESGAINVTDIPASVIDSGRGADGKLYMIPYGMAFGSVLVNETRAQAAGVELPQKGYDWAFLSEWLKSISEKTGKAEAPLLGGIDNTFSAWVRSHGEDLFKDGKLGFSESTVVDFWKYSEDLKNSGASLKAEQAAETRSQAVEQGDFAKGNQSTIFWPANALGTLQATIDKAKPGDKLAAYPLPEGPSGGGTALLASGLAISKNCDNVATAASFIDFFVNDPEASLAYGSDNGANTQTRNLAALIQDPKTSPAKQAELKLYQQIVDEGVAPAVYLKGYASIFTDMLNRHYQQAAFGQVSIEEAAKAFMEEANGLLG
ncbi:carbohydrate ABC transporter substrate-binding protein, CUT1 family [Pseudarthrobacter phenanthrenivorans Sphe3]|uniref:Carbohydrate ABC transporter substrate-binding protein, CUT1 family n=1 Tax=Pseudarthrobacter phenanthrenivorans (strain DSM 18606 / JCM 16027 / LMG 23796 / Sphe3) TaxID=930171 RepID=F0M4L2_PSEPM|nr:extracellular solute-binding protein [Pseudarthrobacter phenanthrenivorans]ADX74559.1 carbohydrate ABC transporter substrate-binding protein, CUT1 family [Pseudarthrobacter phenanthrenivorans Sphe3]